MAEKADSELHTILYLHPEEYTAQALEAAQQEFQIRKLPEVEIEKLGVSTMEISKTEQTPLSWPLKVVAFLVSPLLFGLPAFIAYMHYVSKNERCKASEWARWAWYGFAFYVVGLILRVILS